MAVDTVGCCLSRRQGSSGLSNVAELLVRSALNQLHLQGEEKWGEGERGWENMSVLKRKHLPWEKEIHQETLMRADGYGSRLVYSSEALAYFN